MRVLRVEQALRVLVVLCALAVGGCDDGDGGTDRANEFTLVEIESGTSTPLQLAVQACAGLHNRERGGSVYVQTDAHDAEWLEELDLTPGEVVGTADFLASCMDEFPTCVRYSYAGQQELLPNILTAAAALEAVPLDTSLAADCGEVVWDATVELAGKDDRYLGTEYAFENFLQETTGLAMLNPGYQQDTNEHANPPLNRDMQPALVDYVFARKLFVTFLVNGCIEGNPERELLSDIVNSGQWPTPLGVYGYNNSWLIGGYLYEAQTRCLDSRNMGAIPTETVNLSFFSTRREPIVAAGELETIPPQDVMYDPDKTYVAFVVGDGDNVRFIMSTRKEWMQQRLAACEQNADVCAPLTWSISPHLHDLAPDVLEWYYAAARSTGQDYFTLPPSGHLYAYPASLREEEQDRFIAATEEDARLLGVRGVVHWEWFTTWRDAEERVLPKYASVDGAVRGIFPINVPYSIPIFPGWPADKFYEVLEGDDGGEVALFRPRQWRGIDGRDQFFLRPEAMAAEIAAYPRGTVTWVYMTSDGGLSLENSFMALVPLLPDHVQIVSADAAAELAIAAAND